ncbi:MAG TPA: phosphoribosylaminoimidazolesuccinocarboxamide synthase [Acetobacteraceae bacterium]|nr:phosphoribosylaminoimidazolesuccinocarboxamide synthase [Acetobacteraceae bacterium]
MDDSIFRDPPVLEDATIPGLPGHYRGKVRDNYDLPDGRRILIATDRLSAFDQILACIPYKGQVLTQTARFWFERTADLCPNWALEYPDPNAVVGQRLDILPVEFVVRGYLAGTTSTSILTQYRAGRREMYGMRFPDGMRDNERLPGPIITPTSKAFDGAHDEPLTRAEILERGMLTRPQWDEVSARALALFARGQQMMEARGLILVDTKYEFGTDPAGRILLADEIHTPDSSRFWRASSYAERFARREAPESFDKDFVRAWVAARCDPYRDPIPEIPRELILQTSRRYIEAFETITGERFDPAPGPILPRIRANLATVIP